MTRYLPVDIETFSSVDLRKYGVYRYVESPDFEILMCGWSAGGKTRVAIGRDEIDGIPGLHDPEVIKVAHNAAFERVCFSRHLGLPTGNYLQPQEWVDTAAIAGLMSLPRKLADLADTLGCSPKDSAGTHLINWFCKPDRNGNRRLPQDHPEKWAAFVAYCAQDVDTLVEVWELLPEMPPSERDVYIVDQLINDRGISVDTEMAELAIEADNKNRVAAGAEMRRLLDIENENSVPQILKGLSALGLDLPDLRADTVKEAIETTPDPDIKRALQLRQETALVAAKKYQAALGSTCSDGRLRGQFLYCGAHTTRWSSRGVQIQNLPQAQVKHEESALLDLRLGLGADSETLKGLVRALFVGPFTVADFKSIEALLLAWVAGETWIIEAFRMNRDIYAETAKRMGGLTRQQGKISVLALGYNGGIGSLRGMGAEGTDEQLQRQVVQWRKANPRIVSLWKTLERVFIAGGRAGRLAVERDGKDRHLVLPSGGSLTYRKVSGHSGNIAFTDHHGRRASTYGGRLTENAIQAISRDLLAHALISLEERRYPVVGHVHDEVIVEGEVEVDTITKIICDLPDWANGLPLSADGFTCSRYRKG